MKQYTVYDTTGKILKTGQCIDKVFLLQANRPNRFVVEGRGNDVTQKVVDGKIVSKLPEEIGEIKKPKAIIVPFEKQKASITNEKLQNILKRLETLENK